MARAWHTPAAWVLPLTWGWCSKSPASDAPNRCCSAAIRSQIMRRARGPTCATHRAKSSGRYCARDLRPHRSLCRLAIDWTSPPRFASSWRVRGRYAFRNRRGWRIISSPSSAVEVDANGPSPRDEKSCHASERHADTTANDQVLTPPQIRRLRSRVIRRASDSGRLFLLPLQARHEGPGDHQSPEPKPDHRRGPRTCWPTPTPRAEFIRQEERVL